MKIKEQAMGSKSMSGDVEKFNDLKTPSEDIQIRKHMAGGHTPHHEHFQKHSAGHDLHFKAVEKMCGGGMKKMAKGGSTSSRADGIAQRGKTKTKYC